ncbi:hypothetical protein ACRC7T_15755 [Segnochrobactraceae bacterium EtOH-i3]
MRRADLAAAVSAGILDAATADRLAAFWAERAEATDRRGEVVDVARNFNEVFVSVGVLLLLVGPAVLGVVVATVPLAWMLAEGLRALRPGLRLPMLVLAVGFVGATIAAVLTGMEVDPLFPEATPEDAGPLILAGLVGAAASALFGARFRTPISAGGVAVGLGAALFGALPLLTAGSIEADVALGFGLVVALVAILVDAGDPDRRTRRADVAFWLHLVAAPLIVHGAMGMMGLGFLDTDGIDGAQVAGVLALFAVLALVTLILDRRAPLVSSLSYLAISIGWIAHQADLTLDSAIATAVLLVGAVVLFMGVFWETARRGVLALLPDGRVKAALPPAAPAGSRTGSGTSTP